jgi:hypothetical protein
MKEKANGTFIAFSESKKRSVRREVFSLKFFLSDKLVNGFLCLFIQGNLPGLFSFGDHSL